MPGSQVANEDEVTDFNFGRESEPQPPVNEDGLKFAPKKPEGDLWEIALEPLVKREREQCDVWKEEVQNLLIFAGLFSAVVTAFVIESYKTLHVDPQDTMVTLLSHILVRLENGSATGLPTSSLPSSQATFVPDKSAERINSFWFISLVLSLATALIGIISLQWLREYQSYANFNSEETFAIFNMRKDVLEKWQVQKVFAALPLLLQGALVLFLAGMIDFSLVLGIKVAIPVIIAIALTLAFLLLTTVMPTFQGLLYLFHLPTTNGPQHLVPQCPYKSPQSRAFRILAAPFYAFFRKMHRRLDILILSWRRQPVYRFFVKPHEGTPSFNVVETPTALSVNGNVLERLLSRTTWSEYDQAWLQLRYNVSQEMFDSKVKPGQLHTPYFYLTPYASHLTDLSACLRRIMESNAPETSMAAAYHCFLRVSLSVKDSIDTVLDPTDSLAYDYLSILMNNGMEHPLAGCLDTVGMRQSLYSTALLYQTLADFVSIPGYPVWVDHRLELQILLKRWMCSDYRKLQSSVLVRSVPLPDSIRVRLGSLIATNLAADSPLCLSGRFIILPSTPKELISECCTIYVAFFTCISKGDQYRDWTTSIHMTPEVTEMLTEAACIGYHNLLVPTTIAIADIITNCLQTHLDVLASERDGDHPTYTLLFYAASIYLSAFPKTIPVSWTPSIWSVYEKLEEARMVLVQYKATVLDVVGPDHTIERQFTEYFNSSLYFVDTSQLPRRFTAEWWRFLEEPFLYRAGEEVRIGTGEDGVPITTTFIAPDLPSTS